MTLSKANRGGLKEAGGRRVKEGQSATMTSNRPEKTARHQNDKPLRPERLVALDALRGVALLWMVGFHFCFDLSYFGLIQANFYVDALWTTQRTLILSLFLLCAGAGQALAGAQGQSWSRFWRRWGQIVAAALLVSVASAWLFGDRFIYFGVLHGLAVMLILTRLAAWLGHWLWLLGAVAIAFPFFVSHPFFDPPAWNWLGLVSQKPLTEDYVPLLPWLGVTFWGAAAMHWLLAKRPAWLALWGARRLVWLVALGRRSLLLYLVHQPVMIGSLWLWLWCRG